jgi:triphosphoribosyl-dephospho-CoA synthetase
MVQEEGNTMPEPILFSNNPEHANEIFSHGIDCIAVITSYNEEPDPRDVEHSIIRIGFDYEAAARVIQGNIKFSINVMHIVYGAAGGLINTPKFRFNLDDFKKSMQPGEKLKVKVFENNPDKYVLEVNEVMEEIMRHDAVWR